MSNNFIYDHKVFAFRQEVSLNPSNEKVVLFRDLNSINSFFRSVGKDPNALEDLLNAAKWEGISFISSPKKPSHIYAQQVLEQLGLRIWKGSLLLVEIKMVKGKKFAKCCVRSIKKIDMLLANEGPFKVLTVLSTAGVLFYHPGNALVGQASTYIALYGLDITEIKSSTLEALTHAVVAIPKIVRKKVFDIAQYEAVYKHEIEDSSKELKLFWKGMMDAFS